MGFSAPSTTPARSAGVHVGEPEHAAAAPRARASARRARPTAGCAPAGPRKSAGVRSGRPAENDLKPLSQYASPTIPFGSSLARSALPTGPWVTLRSASASEKRNGRSNDLELAHAERPELRERRREHLHRPELQRLDLLPVLVERAVRVDLDPDAPPGQLLRAAAEELGRLALRRVDRHDVAELQDDGRRRACRAGEREQGDERECSREDPREEGHRRDGLSRTVGAAARGVDRADCGSPQWRGQNALR